MNDKVPGNERFIHEGKAIALGNNNLEEAVSFINLEIAKNKVKEMIYCLI